MRIGPDQYQTGSDEPRKQPDAGETYAAVIGCITDVGIQPGFGGQPPKRKVCVGFEVDWRDEKGARAVLFQKYNLNLWKGDGDKASELRKLFDTLRPGADNSDVETQDFVGMNCRVLLKQDGKGNSRIDRVLPPSKNSTPIRAEKDYSEPFGLTKWLLGNRMDKG